MMFLSGLICIQSLCKDYQYTASVSNRALERDLFWETQQAKLKLNEKQNIVFLILLKNATVIIAWVF